MFVIPSERLPAGFAERVEDPPVPPAEPLPAATAVLLRDRTGGVGISGGPEVLLLQRHHASGFVPGAYVFPGGRVDDEDDSPRAAALLTRALPTMTKATVEPPPAFWIAAVREVLEETGVLLAADAARRRSPDAASDPRLAEWRERLMAGRVPLADVLEAEGLLPAVDDMVYCAHWITPVAEPRRYDTRFFLARVPRSCRATADEREMTDALWMTPAEALARFWRGELPMVFPTVKTLEALTDFCSAGEALDAFRRRPVQPVLPRLVRTEGGIGIVVD